MNSDSSEIRANFPHTSEYRTF